MQEGTRTFGMFRSRRRFIDTQKDTQFSDAWIVLAVILTLLALFLNNGFLSAAAILILTVTGVSWVWSRLSYVGLHYDRHFSERRAFVGETVELNLQVHNRKLLPLTWLNIVDAFPSDLPVEEKDLLTNPATNLSEMRTFWMVGPFQRINRRMVIRCSRRGFYRYGPAQVHAGDPFGFFSRRGHLPDVERLVIYPRLYTVADLHLPTRNPFGDLRASGQLFEDPLRTVGIREWQSRDSLRRVHWKATARHQEMLSRVYEPSEEQQVLLFLNVATMVRHWHGYIPELQERTISVAGSLAALAAEQRLPVGLIANGALPESDQSLRLLPGRNPGQLVRILELLAAITPFSTQPIEEMVLREAPRAPWGATLVVVTAIAHDGLLAALLDLAAAGRRVVLFTLAEQPPERLLPNVTIYHLPHLVDDLILPDLVVTA
jgi:uncharacterized protein (DUF58 family)